MKNSEKEMDSIDWEKEMASLAANLSISQLDYLIIKQFFGSDSLDDRKCEEFKDWFTDVSKQ